MKVAFDENMPATVARTLQTLAADKGFKRLLPPIEFVSAKDYTPRPADSDYVPKSDVPWLRRYRRAGGKIVISGDTKMVRVPHELQALMVEGLVTFFFPDLWNGWKLLRKSGLIIVWIERIIAQGTAAKRGGLYRIPNNWTNDAKILVINPPTPLKLPEVEQPERPSTLSVRARRRSKKQSREEPALLALMSSPPNPSVDETCQSQNIVAPDVMPTDNTAASSS